MKVLFLDIDGVLNSREYDLRRNWNEQTDIDETRLPLVKEIIDKTGAKIVLISTWRSHWDRDENLSDEDGQYINDLFSKYGLAIYDKTQDLGLLSKRKDEVKAWLLEHADEVERFVILDDYRFGWDELSDFYIHTNPNYGLGLEEEHVALAIDMLNSKEQSNNRALYTVQHIKHEGFMRFTMAINTLNNEHFLIGDFVELFKQVTACKSAIENFSTIIWQVKERKQTVGELANVIEQIVVKNV